MTWSERNWPSTLATGATTMAVVLGVLLLGACGLLTATNFCIPSTLLGIWRRRRGSAPAQMPATTGEV